MKQHIDLSKKRINQQNRTKITIIPQHKKYSLLIQTATKILATIIQMTRNNKQIQASNE